MKHYYIPAGTTIQRIRPGSDWEDFVTTRSVEYSEDDFDSSYSFGPHYYFFLPDAAAPFTDIRVKKAVVVEHRHDV